MSDMAHCLPQEPSRWCSSICAGPIAHDILDFFHRRFEENTGEGVLSFGGAEDLDEKLTELSTLLHRANCDRLYAYAIHVCKLSAFLNIEKGKNFVERLYGIIQKVWNDGYRRQKEASKRRRPRTDDGPVFVPDNLLGGWIHDLPLVKNESLQVYVQILACDGLGSQPKFNEAIEAFHHRLLNDTSDRSPRLTDACGESLIRCVLEPLLETNAAKVVECLPYAADIALAQASDNDYESVRVFRRLVDHMRKSKVDRAEKSKLAHSCRRMLDTIADVLSNAFWSARDNGNFNLCQELEHLIPAAGGRERNRRLKAPQGLCVNMLLGEKDIHMGGVVKGIDVTGRYYHVCFDDVSDAAVVKNTKRQVEVTKGCPIKIVDLHVAHKRGIQRRFSEAQAVFRVQDESVEAGWREANSLVLPIRGWRYKHSNPGHAGAVFWVKDPPVRDVSKLVPMGPTDGEAERSDEIDAPNPGLMNSSPGSGFAAHAGTLSNTLFDPGPEGLMVGTKDFLKGLSDEILLNKMWELFWADRKPRRPVEERVIDALLRKSFGEYVRSRGGHLTYQENPGLGPCDYVVSRGTDAVVIELKRSMGNWRQGVSSELPTQMNAKGTKYGMFLLFAFCGQFSTPSPELKELIEKRDAVCREREVRIDIAVVTCDKPESASRRKAPPSPGEGLQYYSWDFSE